MPPPKSFASSTAHSAKDRSSGGVTALTFQPIWLGRQDSNLGSRDQNPLPYHLATPQQRAENTGERAGGQDPADGVQPPKRVTEHHQS